MTRQELQQQIISNLILDENLYFQFSDQLQDYMFKDNHICKSIFDAFVKLVKDSKKPDIITLSKTSGVKFTEISELIQQHNTNIKFENAILFLNSESLRMRLRENLIKYTNLIEVNDPLDAVGLMQKDLNELNTYNAEKVNTFESELNNFLNSIDSDTSTGLQTPFTYLNKITGGLQPSDLIILAAETSQGKTSLALNLAAGIAANNEPGMIASYEMSNNQLIGRILSFETEMPLRNIYKKEISEYDMPNYLERISKIKKYPLYIYDIKNNSINNLCNSVRRHKILFDIKYLVVDYLQLIRLDGTGSREQEVGTISRMLKNLAKELDITIILLSQLHRSKDHIPTLSRLRDSGQIEEAADIVIFIYRQDVYESEGCPDTYSDGTPIKDTAKIYVAKGRNIGIGDFYLKFNKELTKFSNYGSEGNDYNTF